MFIMLYVVHTYTYQHTYTYYMYDSYIYIVCSPTCVISGQRVSAVEGWDPRKRLWVHVDALVRHFAGPFIIYNWFVGRLVCFGVARV